MSSKDINISKCEKCLVYGTNDVPLSRARLINGGDKIWMIFDNQNLKPVTVEVLVDFYGSQKGVIRYLCNITIVRNEEIGNTRERWAGECVLLEYMGTIQRQKDLRVPVKKSALFQNLDGTVFLGTIENISAGGIFLLTTQKMSNGTIFLFEYTFDDTLCKLQARVLRGRVVNGQYGYGCQFYMKSAAVDKTIRQFVYNIQMKKKLETVERQKDLRVPVKISVLCQSPDGTMFRGTIENISAGGFFLVTPQKLSEGFTFQFEHTFERTACKMQARVLRGRIVNGQYGYGCQFFMKSIAADKVIRQFVYNRQLRQRQPEF